MKLYPSHPAQILQDKTNIASAAMQKKWNLPPPSFVQPARNEPRTPEEKLKQERTRQRSYDQDGRDRDGQKKPGTVLMESKTWNRFNENLVQPGLMLGTIAEGGTAGVGALRSLTIQAERIGVTQAKNVVTVEGAVWAQKTFSGTFSAGGKFAGQTVEGVAGALKSGTLSATDVPINVVVRNGQTFILNTRSSAALMQAGIPRSTWNVVNQTGVSSFERMLTEQLSRNGLTNGTNTIRQSGTQIKLSH